MAPIPRRIETPIPGPCFGGCFFARLAADDDLAGARVDDDLAGAFGAGFLAVERLAPDPLFERV